MNPTQEATSARCAYGFWFILALVGAWAYHSLTPFSLRAAQGMMGDIAALPSGYRLYLNLQPFLWATPVCFLILGFVCKRLSILRHPMAISIFGSLLTVLYFFMGVLLATPYFMYAGSPPFPDKLKTQLREAEELTVYALWATNDQQQASQQFHDYPIAGTVNLKNHPKRLEVIEALIRGSETNSTEMACFYPHHGLRVVQQGKTIDLLICFGCGKVEHHPSGEFYHMHKSAQPVLDSLIAGAGIPLPPESKKKTQESDKIE